MHARPTPRQRSRACGTRSPPSPPTQPCTPLGALGRQQHPSAEDMHPEASGCDGTFSPDGGSSAATLNMSQTHPNLQAQMFFLREENERLRRQNEHLLVEAALHSAVQKHLVESAVEENLFHHLQQAQERIIEATIQAAVLRIAPPSAAASASSMAPAPVEGRRSSLPSPRFNSPAIPDGPTLMQARSVGDLMRPPRSPQILQRPLRHSIVLAPAGVGAAPSTWLTSPRLVAAHGSSSAAAAAGAARVVAPQHFARARRGSSPTSELLSATRRAASPVAVAAGAVGPVGVAIPHRSPSPVVRRVIPIAPQLQQQVAGTPAVIAPVIGASAALAASLMTPVVPGGLASASSTSAYASNRLQPQVFHRAEHVPPTARLHRTSLPGAGQGFEKGVLLTPGPVYRTVACPPFGTQPRPAAIVQFGVWHELVEQPGQIRAPRHSLQTTPSVRHRAVQGVSAGMHSSLV
mmetsp:Transcript_47847/g.152876  ORF Transcript_47847/g.152876 Transcript_47847/m.152876 type:complete len:463 (+) Transcript_47847:131-1519(+)